MIPLADARALVLDRCPRGPPRGGAGRRPGHGAGPAVLATEAGSAVRQFGHGRLRRAGRSTPEVLVDRPVRLRVVATLAAGAALDRTVEPGEAVRIMTGAPMPPAPTRW